MKKYFVTFILIFAFGLVFANINNSKPTNMEEWKLAINDQPAEELPSLTKIDAKIIKNPEIAKEWEKYIYNDKAYYVNLHQYPNNVLLIDKRIAALEKTYNIKLYVDNNSDIYNQDLIKVIKTAPLVLKCTPKVGQKHVKML